MAVSFRLAPLRDSLQVIDCHLFYAADGVHWYLSGSTVCWNNLLQEYAKKTPREKLRFSWNDPEPLPKGKRSWISPDWTPDRSPWLPEPMASFLASAGAEQRDVLFHLIDAKKKTSDAEQVRDEQPEPEPRGLLVLVDPKQAKSAGTRGKHLSVEEGRKLALLTPVLLWSIEARLETLAKDRFIAMWKHGTKGALASVLKDVAELKRAYYVEQRAFVESALEAMDAHSERLRMGHLTGDFYLNCMRGAPPNNRRTAVEVMDIINVVKSLCEPEARDKKGLSIRHEFVKGTNYNTKIRANRDMAILALYNTVYNAVKYSYYDHPHGVKIKVGSASGVVTIEVIDFGVPVPEEDLDLIFDPYYRSMVQDKRYDRPGTGIGLYLTREIVRDHGGVVSADCRPDSETKAHCVTVKMTYPKA